LVKGDINPKIYKIIPFCGQVSMKTENQFYLKDILIFEEKI